MLTHGNQRMQMSDGLVGCPWQASPSSPSDPCRSRARRKRFIAVPITFCCPNPACKHRLTAKDELAGKVLKCPKCAQPVRVPSATDMTERQTTPPSQAQKRPPPVPKTGPSAAVPEGPSSASTPLDATAARLHPMVRRNTTSLAESVNPPPPSSRLHDLVGPRVGPFPLPDRDVSADSARTFPTFERNVLVEGRCPP